MSAIADLCSFIDASSCPSLAAKTLATRLRKAGFSQWLEGNDFEAKPGSKAFIQRGAAIIACVVRGTPTRYHVIGAHTDSPHLRLKPNAAYNCEGSKQLAVEVYGGALWNSWLDRDLGLAGVVHGLDGRECTIRLDRPLARISQLAIHLDRRVNEDGLKLNSQLHLAPMWGLGGDAGAEFLALLSEATDIPAREIVSHDLSLFDITPARLGGAANEFIFAGRLDNLASCHAGIEALIASIDSGHEDTLSVLACFDHEEVGSTSASGADGSFASVILERLATSLGLTRSQHLANLSRSLLLSADMAHAVHPNYVDRHEPRHKPYLGHGPVLKSNHNQRYATTAATAASIHRYSKIADTELQNFVTRTDLGCGSTIGPSSAALLGMPVADVGNPMLSMHSIRECAASSDHEPYIRLLTAHVRGE